MKNKIYLALLAICSGLFFTACEDHSYPLGLPEYEHHYYIAFLPNNNSTVTLNKTQTTLAKFPVQFHSVYTRDYDAVAKYKIVTPSANPAIPGVDFNVVDKNGTVLTPVNGEYSITFEKAVYRKDTIYIKLLNNPASGTRNTEIQLLENITPVFTVDTINQAYRRPLKIQ